MYVHRCVIDGEGYYKHMVLAEIADDGREAIQYYTLEPGESLVNTKVSGKYVRPRWNGTQWIEGATAEEIAEWEAAHPVPGSEGPTLVDRVADIEDALAEIVFGPGETGDSTVPKSEGGTV
ncbi:hypothetical protein [Gehongia tenuis]|uniref:Uncharacterized protein n=1 Tax=Gehongia tenuis TaxID=2763655 RepID=A0A926D3L6_9FIRM|nr:hypothetical protein [Gehongia tenuis]MBC8531760.1 hypothetical protein [Gehongia tenuis]